MWVVISSILIATLISFFYLQDDYRKKLVSVQNQLIDIEKGYGGTLAASIYAEDEEQTLNAIKGILKLPDMVQVDIFNVDDQDSMIKQGIEINSWGKNIYVKVPVVNSKNQFTGKVIKNLFCR